MRIIPANRLQRSCFRLFLPFRFATKQKEGYDIRLLL